MCDHVLHGVWRPHIWQTRVFRGRLSVNAGGAPSKEQRKGACFTLLLLIVSYTRSHTLHDHRIKVRVRSSRAGCDNSLTRVRECFLAGYATKDDFEKALCAHQESKDETRSDQRDAAAADKNLRTEFEK